ncbi:Uncharacterized protein FWK35_00030365, partial [Aphis craccivora]
MYNASVGTSSQTNAAANKRDYAQKSTATKKRLVRFFYALLLNKICVKNCSQLTPRWQKFYHITKKLFKQSRRDGVKNQLFKDRLKSVERFTDEFLISKYSHKMSATASMFMRLQVRETTKSGRGHRFSMDEKMFSLSLYIKSPKCYRMLSTLFTLPYKRTLNALLSTVTIRPGICSLVMDVLKENVKKLKPIERYCSILFDEMCLSSGLNYNSSVDIIEGFVDFGTHRNQNFGDHVLVYMVRGIKKKFKQPISYTFFQGATNQYELVRQLKEVIAEIHKTGLTVVATIYDFYEIEVRRENGNIERLPIIHLFDVPYLMKCTRNNLLTKNLNFVTENTPKIAKLTDCHVMPDKIPKMKVRYSTQVFSQRVSAIISFLASKSVIDHEAAHTAELFLFFDKLFDSLNGSFTKLWRFLGKNEKPVKVPTLNNWITTIKGFQTLSKHLESNRIKSFLPRHLNQDSLESLFGGARSVSCQNPTCGLFVSSYKTLLLNNCVSSYSPGSNCEEFTESCLLTYKNLFSFSPSPNPTQSVLLSCDLPKKVAPYTDKITEDLKLLTLTYIAGFIIKNLNKI